MLWSTTFPSPLRRLHSHLHMLELAMLSSHNPRRELQCALAVRDHDQRAIAAKFGERFVDQPLAFDVDLAGRLVENQDFGVAEESTGQGNTLALPAADTLAVGTHNRVVAVGER